MSKERPIPASDLLREIYYSLRGPHVQFNRSFDPEDTDLWLVEPTFHIAKALNINPKSLWPNHRSLISGLTVKEFSKEKVARLEFGDWHGEMQFNWENGDIFHINKRFDKGDGQYWGLYDEQDVIPSSDKGEGKIYTFYYYPLGSNCDVSDSYDDGSAKLYYHWNKANTQLSYISHIVNPVGINKDIEFKIPQSGQSNIKFRIDPLGEFSIPAEIRMDEFIKNIFFPRMVPALTIDKEGNTQRHQYLKTYDFLGVEWDKGWFENK